MAYRRGHCTGTKQEKAGAQDWYKAHEAEHIARIEAEWAARQAEAVQLELIEDGQLALFATAEVA